MLGTSMRPSRIPVLVAFACVGGIASGQTTYKASLGPGGMQSDDVSTYSAVSDDGNVIAIQSYANTFASGDTKGTFDIFVRDVAADTLECLSLSTSGVPGTGSSVDPHVSADGRYVAFVSDAPSLVPNDTNGTYDVFWFDRQTATLRRVSVDSSGGEGIYGGYEARLSKDGQLVMFSSYSDTLVANDTNGTIDVFLHDVATGTTERISTGTTGNEGSDASFSGGLSFDHRYAVFASYANDLDPLDANPGGDVFVKDRQTGTLTLVSLDSSGAAANDSSFYSTISGDGQVVAFVSYATNLVAGDTNGQNDVFVRDLPTGVTTRASVSDDGTKSGYDCYYPILSEDGRYVAFPSGADLIPGTRRFRKTVFVRDLLLGFMTSPAVDANGEFTAGESDRIAMSSDGRFTSFSCDRDDLVAGDTNRLMDVFVHDMPLTAASSTNFGTGLAGTNGIPSLTSTLPLLATDCTVTIGNSLGATTPAVIFLGDTAGTIPTNLGHDILLIPQILMPLALPPSGLSFTEAVPADEFLTGAVVYLQVLEIDPGALKGVSFTPRLDLTIGR